MTEWGMIALLVMLVLSGAWILLRRRRTLPVR
jgi:uncharacterized protein (TIGR03382 family)